MEKYMNVPLDKEWTRDDVEREYELCSEVKKVAKIYDITVKEVREIIKSK